MPLTILTPLLFLLAALLARGLSSASPRSSQIVAAICPLLCLAIVLLQRTTTGSQIQLHHWEDDSLSRLALTMACFVTLIVALLESTPFLLATTLWSAGMLALGSVSNYTLMQWSAVQFSILPLLLYGRGETDGLTDGVGNRLKRHATLILGSLLFGLGTLAVSQFDNGSPAITIGVVLLICGLGGLLNWFPFPRVVSPPNENSSVGAIFGKSLLPILTAAVFLIRLVERHPLTHHQANLLALAAFFSLLLCSARLLTEERLSRRLHLSMLSCFCFLLISICLANWQLGTPHRDWQYASNLPGGQSLFLSILICETAALLLLACGFSLLTNERPDASNRLQQSSTDSDFTQTLEGVCGRRPLASLIAILALLSLAGIPPFPGFWWRFGLISALLLPHQQSNITQLVEADQRFILLALLSSVLFIINSLGHLRLLQQMLFEHPFRVRNERSTPPVRIATGIAMIPFLMALFVPLSIGRMFQISAPISLPISVPVPIVDPETCEGNWLNIP